MKCLSIRQPWAEYIVLGLKDVENRSRTIKYRGRLLIHAPLRADKGGEDLPLGMIVGAVDLVDCVERSSSKWFEGPFGLVMDNAVKFKKPIPWKGQLSMFNVPDDIAKKLR